MEEITTDLVADLYREYRADLARVRHEQRRLRRDDTAMKAQLDDIEAEITYLLLRHARPETVVEVGTFHGWSTTWILRALRDNDRGQLHSFDLLDEVRRHVPAELAAERWSFTQGDARGMDRDRIPPADHLFLDADHGRRFARVVRRAPVPRGPRRGSGECARRVPRVARQAVQRGLRGGAVARRARHPVLTTARRKAPDVQQRLIALKDELGLGEPVRVSPTNPMIFFRMA